MILGNEPQNETVITFLLHRRSSSSVTTTRYKAYQSTDKSIQLMVWLLFLSLTVSRLGAMLDMPDIGKLGIPLYEISKSHECDSKAMANLDMFCLYLNPNQGFTSITVSSITEIQVHRIHSFLSQTSLYFV